MYVYKDVNVKTRTGSLKVLVYYSEISLFLKDFRMKNLFIRMVRCVFCLNYVCIEYCMHDIVYNYNIIPPKYGNFLIKKHCVVPNVSI